MLKTRLLTTLMQLFLFILCASTWPWGEQAISKHHAAKLKLNAIDIHWHLAIDIHWRLDFDAGRRTFCGMGRLNLNLDRLIVLCPLNSGPQNFLQHGPPRPQSGPPHRTMPAQ